MTTILVTHTPKLSESEGVVLQFLHHMRLCDICRQLFASQESSSRRGLHMVLSCCRNRLGSQEKTSNVEARKSNKHQLSRWKTPRVSGFGLVEVIENRGVGERG